jgi:N12 class adenine-specific DNA methylase
LAAPAREAAPKANFRITDDRLGEGGAKEKYQYNIAAIKTLQGIEREGRAATPGEQETLSRYVGWGGMPQAFDGGNEKWSAEHQELKSLLSPAEYESARASALNAYYTAPTVIRAMYETLGRMGFSDGSLLEPSCGVGNFLGLVPESMARAELHGVELDSITGRIAVQLYQDADIQVKGYEKTSFADNQFDVAIGNVPFGSYQVADGRYSKHGFHIHDYFFAKTLDKVRPGGIVAFVTSKGTLDKANPKARKYMAERAELLGAVRLPNNAFLKNAGTEVTSDIVFLQKRESPIAVEPDWVHLGKTPDGIPINSYFADNPHMVLGAMSLGKGMYGNATETTCNPIPGADLREQLKDALANIQGRIAGRGLAASDIGKDGGRLPADPDVRDYSYTLAGGAVYYREGGFMDPVKASADTLARCKSMIGLEEAVRGLIAAQLDGLPDGAVNGKQAELNALYDGFVAKHGLINTPANKKAFDGDSAFFLLASLEEKDKDGNTRKADIFTKRTVTPNTEVTAAGTASEALAISIGQLARVDMGYMQALTGFSEEKLAADLQGVVYRDLGAYRPDYGSYKQKYPTEAQISEEIRAQIGPETYDIAAKPYVTAEEYLSGNVRQKLRVAKELAASRPDLAGMVAPNIAALEQVQPTELEAADITANLGATWIHKDYVQQFVVDTLGLPPPRRYGKNLHTVSYSETTGSWNIADKANSYGSTNTLLTETYGTKRVNAFKIIEETLNLKDVRVFDRTADDRSVLNQKETELAQQRQEKIKREFREWLFKDPARRQSLCSYYNDIYNSARLRAYDGSHIAFGGINPEIGLKRHQTGAIARIIYNGNTLLAHEVGAGKTFEMIAAAMEMKRLGLCGKSLFVVPNHITEQTAAEFMRLYPAANILVATEKDFSADNRKKFCARVATGDYDAVIIGHSQFEKIPVSKERQAAFIEDQIFEIVRGIDELRRERGDKFTIKEMERTKKSLEAKLSKLINDGRKDDVVTFEELGIDRLFVDEAHYYKNLQMYTKMRNVAGLSQGEAQKSTDMFMKCRYMDEKTGGKGVVFATGTPISNSMIEMYTMKKYLYFDKLTEKGFAHFDSWASTFGEAVTANEISPDGGYRSKTRFSRFQGLPELMGMFNEFADIKTADTLQLPRPEARFHTVAVKPTEHQKELVKALSERAKAVHEKRVDPTVDNMLKITTDGRKTGLDQRLIDENLPDDPASKVNACKDNIFRIWEETKGDRLAQLVFCDFSTPGKGRFNLYDDIKNKLVAKGIPESEIAFIHDADTKEKKAAMFDKVRSGEIRVMFGSTAKCGSGTNVQDRLVALHDLDCPWRPADLEQRAGRIIRQGNRNREVDIYRYVTEATFDAYLFQTIENKQKFISQIMTSKSPARVCEDVDEQVLSYAEIKALCAGNPLIKEKIDLESEVGKLKMLKAEHRNQQYRMQDRKLTALPQAIEACRQTVRNLEADLATVAANTRKEESGISPMVINGAAYTSRADAGAALMAACKGMDRGDNAASAVIGSYRGLEMRLSFDFFKTEWKITLKGGHSHEAALGSDASGNVARIDNAIGGIADRLGDSKTRLSLLEKEMGDIDVMLERPFEFEGKLAEKTERLAEVEALLCQDSEKQGNDGQDPAAHGGQDGAGRFSMDGVKRDIAEITGNRAKSGYAAGFQQAQNVR